MTFRRFVAVGDSFTEGIFDDVGPAGGYVGWADRLAVALTRGPSPDLRYANHAVRGKLLDQAVAEQLPVALAAEPDLLAFHVGGNDALRSSVDVDELVVRWQETVAELVAPGRTILVLTVLERCGVASGPTARFTEPLARRIAVFNDGVRAGAEQHGLALVDIAATKVLEDRRLWHADRLHLNTAGHARVTHGAAAALGLADDSWTTPFERRVRGGAARELASDAGWVGMHLAPWMIRRLRGISSGDGRAARRATLSPVEPELMAVVDAAGGAPTLRS